MKLLKVESERIRPKSSKKEEEIPSKSGSVKGGSGKHV
jgi:hypothetical protein